jgi:uncharacterized protein YceK
MKNLLLLLLPLILFSSCATILNKPNTKTSLYTSSPAKIIIDQDTLSTTENKVDIILPRSKDTISIITITDSTKKTFHLNPKNSIAYYGNIPFNYGIGMLIDRNNSKRYKYPSQVYVDFADTLHSFSTYDKNNKHKWFLHLSLPHVNHFQFHPANESTKTNTGFWGFNVGISYYHQNTQFLAVSVSGVTDFFLPVPAAVDISGEYELMSSRYLGISNNHLIRRFTLGYGLSYARNTWDLRYYDRFNPPPPSRNPVKKSSNALGFIFSSYYNMGRSFTVGVTYRPTFYRLDIKPALKYEHLVSLDFGWNILLPKRR